MMHSFPSSSPKTVQTAEKKKKKERFLVLQNPMGKKTPMEATESHIHKNDINNKGHQKNTPQITRALENSISQTIHCHFKKAFE